MTKSQKTILKGLLPFGVLLFFILASYESKNIQKGGADPKVTTSLNENPFYQSHLKCVEFAKMVSKANFVDIRKDEKRAMEIKNEASACQKHSSKDWHSLGEQNQIYLRDHTNTEFQLQYLLHISSATLEILDKNLTRESDAYQSALSIIRMEVPKSQIKKSVGPLSFLFLLGLLAMWVVFRKDPGAQKIANDGRIFGIRYRNVVPKRNKEGEK